MYADPLSVAPLGGPVRLPFPLPRYTGGPQVLPPIRRVPVPPVFGPGRFFDTAHARLPLDYGANWTARRKRAALLALAQYGHHY